MTPYGIFLLLVLTGGCMCIPQYPGGSEDLNTLPTDCGNPSYDCVPYFQCDKNGYINTDGAGIIDQRIKTEGVCSQPGYPDVPAVCCLKPGEQSCPVTHECVEYSQCSAKGTIVTDGSGLIDIRTSFTSCYLDYGGRGICCLPPTPYYDNCPSNSVCTLGSDCYGQALDYYEIFVNYQSTGLWSSCSYGTTDGVCCKPPHVDNCPTDSVCILGSDCSGRAYDASSKFIDYVSTGLWTSCSYDGIDGVCCTSPHIDNCPVDSVCVLGSDCYWRALDASSNFIDYLSTGSWTSCSYSGIDGVCCIPPSIDDCPMNSVCTLGSDCFGQALNAYSDFIDYVSTGLWTSCQYGNAGGICCISPPIEYCPENSVCLPDTQCVGTAYDSSNNWVTYDYIGSWTYCKGHTIGVCCINPKDPVLHTADTCGVRNSEEHLKTRISSQGHSDAAFGEFPWQAILFYQNYTFVCGATLVSNKHLITAAHCVNGLLASDIRIRLGEWQVNSFDEKLPYKDGNIRSIFQHKDFHKDNLRNDIAVLELVTPLETFDYHINSVCLPNQGQVFDPYGKRCFTTGWGKDSFTGNFQHILKKIDLPMVDHDQCQNLLRKTRLGKWFRLDQSFVCAGGELNKDACYGDGGGPLVCEDTTNRWVLTGITSWGIGCGTANVPGVYVNVNLFRDWIDAAVGFSSQQQIPGYGK